jgi:hypothetical protein
VPATAGTATPRSSYIPEPWYWPICPRTARVGQGIHVRRASLRGRGLSCLRCLEQRPELLAMAAHPAVGSTPVFPRWESQRQEDRGKTRHRL